jgi:hypothetical protein
MGDEDLNAKLKTAAENLVGEPAVESKYGIDCFGLVDKLLRELGAQTAADGKVKITLTADYDWGDRISLDSIQPGDILQFKKHVVHIHTVTKEKDRVVTADRYLYRPHHTAIVLEVHTDGKVTVIEQNVSPDRHKVIRSVIPMLRGEESKVSGKSETTIKVRGSVKAYRPAPKPPKGASLLPPHKSAPVGGSRRMLAFFVPSQGGPKRTPGPLGREVQWPDEAGDITRLV